MMNLQSRLATVDVNVREGREGSEANTTDLYTYEGKPRLSYAVTYFFDILKDLPFDSLVDFYCDWRDFDEYYILQKQVWDDRKGVIKTDMAFKCNKRGNDVYFDKLDRKLSLLKRSVPNKRFFGVRENLKFTPVIFCTLTFGSSVCDIKDAWRGIGEDFNRWITGVRQRFGRVGYVRCWEAFRSGYPHIHVLLFFEEVEFRVLPFWNKRKRIYVWRVVNIRCVSDRMKSKWDGYIPSNNREVKELFEFNYHSFVDVQGCESVRIALDYVLKYMNKYVMSDFTLALCWIFRKQSFAISRTIYVLFNSIISNSNRSARFQVSLKDILDGKDTFRVVQIPVYVFIGVFSASSLGISSRKWFIEGDFSHVY